MDWIFFSIAYFASEVEDDFHLGIVIDLLLKFQL